MTRATMNAFTLPSSAAPDTSSAASCVTSSATSCAASFTGSSFTCSSFTCHLRESVAWFPPLADDDGQDKHLHDAWARACWAWVLSWQMTMGMMNTFAVNTFALPSFAALNTSSATSCAKSFTCVLHVSPKSRRGGELELIQSHMAQKPVLRGEVGCACVAHQVSVERGGGTRVLPSPSLRCLKSPARPPPHPPRRLGSAA